jgi:hypothetical protein
MHRKLKVMRIGNKPLIESTEIENFPFEKRGRKGAQY